MTLPGRLVLVGHPVAHSLSPVMHNAALRAAGIPLVYETVDVLPENLSTTFDELASAGAAGNVTVPHKASARELMTRVSDVARRVGAINTFRLREERLGDNTDVFGFQALVTSLLGNTPTEARVAIVGAGGSAAAVLAAVETWERASAVIYARTREPAEKLAERFNVVRRVESIARTTRVDCDIVVNATSVGLNGDAFPIPLEALPTNAVVVDLVYRANETAWVRAARAAGHRASDGLPMLVEQGAASFEIWFEIQPDRETMWRAVKEATGRV